MSDIHCANMANYHHYCYSDVFICSYRATQFYFCISRGHVVKVHQQQSMLGMCKTFTLILVLLQAVKKFNTVNSSAATEIKTQIEYQRSLAQVQV